MFVDTLMMYFGNYPSHFIEVLQRSNLIEEDIERCEYNGW